MSEISAFPSESPITALRDLLLCHAPPIHARMTEPSYTAKYLRVAQPITDADLAAHLAGDLTLACVLQHDDIAQVAACDIDSGGEAMVRRVMRTAEVRACHAYGFVLDSGGHSGGHVWIFFAHPHSAHDLQVLMHDIVTEAACPTSEIYPNAADLRLPFGVHRRCGRRGTLLLNSSATPLDLDADLPGALASFLTDVRRTSDLPVRVAQEAQHARRLAVIEAIAASRPRRIDPDAHWREVIAHFNASTDLVSLLEGYGARGKYQYANGKVLLHCACPQDHANGDKHPSLVVEPGRGQQAGRMICGCYSPACRLHNQPHQVMDAFEVFCRLEGISKREAVQRLQGGQRVVQTPQYAPEPAAAPAAVRPRPAPVTPSERAVQQRLVDVTADPHVQPLDRRLLAYVISHDAQGQGIANAALASALGVQPDSIKRAKRRLRALGYIDVTRSTDGIHPSAITILGLPVSAPAESSDACAQGESTLPPPFHVAESTCVAQTPPRESCTSPDAEAAPAVTTVVQQDTSASRERPCADLRRRRGVLRGMLRHGGSARQLLAWNGELARIEAALVDTGEAAPMPPQFIQQGASYAEPQALSAHHGLRLAQSDMAHPTLSDEQLTALLRDALEAQGVVAQRLLLGRVSWHLGADDSVTLVCTVRDLHAVTEQLRVASWLALTDILPECSLSVTVQIGQPVPVAVRPSWLVESLWGLVPLWLRSQLVGSVLLDERLYGATPERTADLGTHGEIVAWLLDQVVMQLDDLIEQPGLERSVGSAGA